MDYSTEVELLVVVVEVGFYPVGTLCPVVGMSGHQTCQGIGALTGQGGTDYFFSHTNPVALWPPHWR